MKCAALDKIHVFGGTSDAIQICQMLQEQGLAYSLSVATQAGSEVAAILTGKVYEGRLTVLQMQVFFVEQQITLVIDATHPFAAEVSKNIIQATSALGLPLIRYERPSQIDLLEHPLLIKVADAKAACNAAKKLGNKLFLTTGSKELGFYKQALPEKTLIVRVLPSIEVIKSCVALGFGIGEIVAIKGPFNEEMNKVMYRFYQVDAVITKESGVEGGYQEKVLPCLELGITCIVICRPKQLYQHFVSTLSELESQLQLFKK